MKLKKNASHKRHWLLPATEVTEAGYRLYDEVALERLQHILGVKHMSF